eukprot:scaffold31669_cov31-Phaeocystis_antarctica.AAC.4
MYGACPFACAGPKTTPSSPRAKTAAPISKPPAAPARMTSCPTRCYGGSGTRSTRRSRSSSVLNPCSGVGSAGWPADL